MTARNAIAVLILGYAVAYSGEFLAAAAITKVMALLVLAGKVWGYPGFRDFLDR